MWYKHCIEILSCTVRNLSYFFLFLFFDIKQHNVLTFVIQNVVYATFPYNK